MTSKSPEVEETSTFVSIFGNGGGKDAATVADAREDETRDREAFAGGSGAGPGSTEMTAVGEGEGEMVPQMAVDRYVWLLVYVWSTYPRDKGRRMRFGAAESVGKVWRALALTCPQPQLISSDRTRPLSTHLTPSPLHPVLISILSGVLHLIFQKVLNSQN